MFLLSIQQYWGTSVYMQTSVIYKNILPSYTWKYVSGMSLKILNINFCKRGALRNTRTVSETEVILAFVVQVNNILSVHEQILHSLSLFPSKVNTEFSMKLPL